MNIIPKKILQSQDSIQPAPDGRIRRGVAGTGAGKESRGIFRETSSL